MFCKNCGGQNPNNAEFCTHCGIRVNNSVGNDKPNWIINTLLYTTSWDNNVLCLEK